MLEPACFHHEALRYHYSRAMARERSRYYRLGPYADYHLDVESNDYSAVQRVSLCDETGAIVGFLAADVDRTQRMVDELQVIRFTDGPDPSFTRDLITFFRTLHAGMDLRKIRFSCRGQNPVLPSYRAVAARYGGREIGVAHREVLLPDGTEDDLHLFEVPCAART
jgi:hypothetical protein